MTITIRRLREEVNLRKRDSPSVAFAWHLKGNMVNHLETPEGVFPLEVWRYEKSITAIMKEIRVGPAGVEKFTNNL